MNPIYPKSIFQTFFLLCSLNAFSQALPSDSLILRKIFGKVDKGGMSYTQWFEKEGEEELIDDSAVFRVVFKHNVILENKALILSIVEAPSNQRIHGHSFGYQHYYFLQQVRNKLQVVDSIVSEGPVPIGDVSEFSIVDIGKNKQAIVSIFQSTGNHHFERTTSLDLLQPSELKYLVSIESEYDNSAFRINEREDSAYQAHKHEESFEIIKSDQEWYNIKVHRIDYLYTKDLQETNVEKESDKVLIYQNGKYEEQQ